MRTWRARARLLAIPETFQRRRSHLKRHSRTFANMAGPRCATRLFHVVDDISLGTRVGFSPLWHPLAVHHQLYHADDVGRSAILFASSTREIRITLGLRDHPRAIWQTSLRGTGRRVIPGSTTNHWFELFLQVFWQDFRRFRISGCPPHITSDFIEY